MTKAVNIRSSGQFCTSNYNLHFVQYAYAAEVYEKLEDSKALVAVYVETHQWKEVRCSSLDHSTVYETNLKLTYQSVVLDCHIIFYPSRPLRWQKSTQNSR